MASVKSVTNTQGQASAAAIKQKNKNKAQNFATRDHGGVHIAQGDRYVGFVPTYNNCVTRFFANLLGWSYQITADGNTYDVERGKYLEFLNAHTVHDQEITTASVWDNLDLSKLTLKPEGSIGLMRDHISAEKAERLYKRMIHALVVENDVEKAKLFAGKGALVDTSFWIRDNVEGTFAAVAEGLPDDEPQEFAAAHLTPLLYAAEKGHDQFCDFLEELKANTNLKGEYVIFTKTTKEENPSTSFAYDNESTEDDGSLKTCITLKTISTLEIEDYITTKFTISYNPETGKIERKESTEEPLKQQYQKPLETYTTQCKIS